MTDLELILVLEEEIRRWIPDRPCKERWLDMIADHIIARAQAGR